MRRLSARKIGRPLSRRRFGAGLKGDAFQQTAERGQPGGARELSELERDDPDMLGDLRAVIRMSSARRVFDVINGALHNTLDVSKELEMSW